MASAEQSSTDRLIARLERGGTEAARPLLSRLETRRQAGVISHPSGPSRGRANRSSYGSQSAVSNGMLDRLMRRTGLSARPNEFGLALSSLSSEFVAAVPPWLARSEEVPAGESPVRRKRSPASSPAPVIAGWGAVVGVPGSSPIARSRPGALSRASGISPPALSAPSYSEAGSVTTAPPAGPLRRSGTSPASPWSAAGSSPSSPWSAAGPSPAQRRATRGQPLSHTVASIQRSSAIGTALATSTAASSPRSAVRQSREQGSSREPGRGFRVARAAARLASTGIAWGPDLALPSAPLPSATPISAEQRSEPARTAAPATIALSRSTDTDAASRSAATGTPAKAPSATAPSATTETARRSAMAGPRTALSSSPMARAIQRSATRTEANLSARSSVGAARRASTLASTSLALAEPAPSAETTPTSAISTPLTRQSVAPEVARTAGIPSANRPVAGSTSSTATQRSAPTPLARALGKNSGLLASIQSRAASVETPLSNTQSGSLGHSTSPLARSFARSQPALPLPQPSPHGFISTAAASAPQAEAPLRRKGPAGQQQASPSSTAYRASTVPAKRPTSMPAASHRQAQIGPSSAAQAPPSSRALGRVGSATAATLATKKTRSLTTPLSGSPVARSLARTGSESGAGQAGLQRTRSLTASAQLGTLPALSRAAESPVGQAALALPMPLSSAAAAQSPAARTQAAPTARSQASSGSRAARSMEQTTGPTRPTAKVSKSSLASARSPLARAFERAGESASGAGFLTNKPTPQPQGVATPGTIARWSVGFDASLPSMQLKSTSEVEPQISGPGRGFTLARDAHRAAPRSVATTQHSSLPHSLTLSTPAPAARTPGPGAESSAPGRVTLQAPAPAQAGSVRRSASIRASSSTTAQAQGGSFAAASSSDYSAVRTALSRQPTGTPAARALQRSSNRWTVASAEPSTAQMSPAGLARKQFQSGPTLVAPKLQSAATEIDRHPDLDSAAAVSHSPGRTLRELPLLARSLQAASAATTASAPSTPTRRGMALRRQQHGPRTSRTGLVALPRAHRSAPTDELLQRVAELPGRESVAAGEQEGFITTEAMLPKARRTANAAKERHMRAAVARASTEPSNTGRSAVTPGPERTLVDSTQLENLVRKELTTLSAPRPAVDESEIIALARQALASEASTGVARKGTAKAAGSGGKDQKDLDDLLHRLIRRMLVEEQIGGERSLKT